MTRSTGRRTRRVVVVDERPLAVRIGSRIRAARQRRGMSQRDVAGDRFTPQYISGLERGDVKPSMAALNYLAHRLGVAVRDLLDTPVEPWNRVEADVRLASGDAQGAADRYRSLMDTAPTPVARAEALAGLADALCRLNRGTEAAGLAAESVELFRQNGRLVDAALAQYVLASAQYQSDNLAEAGNLLTHLLDQVRDGLDVEPGFQVRVLTALAAVAGWAGDDRQALAYLEEGRELIESLDPRARAAYLFSMAVSYKQTDDLEAAVRCGLRSLGLYEAIGAVVEVAALHNHLALTYLRLGNLPRAAELAASAAAEVRKVGDSRSEAGILETQAAIAFAEERYAAAAELAERAITTGSDGIAPDAVLEAHLTLARARRAGGADQEATAVFERAVVLARESAPPSRRRAVLAAFADHLTETGQEKRALEIYREAVAP